MENALNYLIPKLSNHQGLHDLYKVCVIEALTAEENPATCVSTTPWQTLWNMENSMRTSQWICLPFRFSLFGRGVEILTFTHLFNDKHLYHCRHGKIPMKNLCIHHSTKILLINKDHFYKTMHTNTNIGICMSWKASAPAGKYCRGMWAGSFDVYTSQN